MIGSGRKGFTFIELAMVLIVMGLVGTVFYGAITKFIGKLKIDEAQEEVLVAQEKFRGYVFAKNGTLPAADPGDLLPGVMGDVTDPWGRPMHYHPATELLADSVGNVNATSLNVNIYDDADLTSLKRTVPNVAYVVISLGPNQQQDYTVSSVNIVSQSGTRTKSDGTEYDDIVEFVTLPELKQDPELAGDEEETTPSDYAYRLNDEESDIEAEGGSLEGNASVGADPDGLGLTVLDLSNTSSGRGGQKGYLDLSDHDANDTSLHDYTTYTIMGWYKTKDNSTNNFDTLTTRQQSGRWQNRTWWVTLWDRSYDGQGGIDTPGELALKAQSTSNQSFFADSNHPNASGHHNQKWHFFAARMSADDPGAPTQYTAEVFVSDDRDNDGAEELLKGADNTTLNAPPKTDASYKLYIGYNPEGSNTRYFRGWIDDIIIYDRALTDDEVTNYFQSSKADYGY